MSNPLISVSKHDLAAAFTEWERRYRENPDAYMAEMEKLEMAAETYGEACASYFLEVLLADTWSAA